MGAVPPSRLADEEERMPTKKKMKTMKTVIATRPVSTLDLTKPLKVSASATPRSKSDVFGTIAQHAGIHRRDVAAVFHALGFLIKADLSKNGAGVFKVPGMMRITVIRKPASKARMGLNPFTKEQVMFKAKPARNVVRVRPLRGLKDMV
jgi:nucleoid DNA-binding protein